MSAWCEGGARRRSPSAAGSDRDAHLHQAAAGSPGAQPARHWYKCFDTGASTSRRAVHTVEHGGRRAEGRPASASVSLRRLHARSWSWTHRPSAAPRPSRQTAPAAQATAPAPAQTRPPAPPRRPRRPQPLRRLPRSLQRHVPAVACRNRPGAAALTWRGAAALRPRLARAGSAAGRSGAGAARAARRRRRPRRARASWRTCARTLQRCAKGFRVEGDAAKDAAPWSRAR